MTGPKSSEGRRIKILRVLLKIFRVPDNIPKWEQLTQLKNIFPIMYIGCFLHTSTALVIFILPFCVADFGTDIEGHIEQGVWALMILGVVKAFLECLITILAQLFKTRKNWAVYTVFIVKLIFALPFLFLFRGVFSFYLWQFPLLVFEIVHGAPGFALLKRNLLYFFLRIFIAVCAMGPVLYYVVSFVYTIVTGPVQRSFSEEIVMIIFNCIAGTIVNSVIAIKFYATKKNFEKFRSRIRSFDTFLKTDKMEDWMDTKKNADDYFSFELDSFFRNFIRHTRIIKSYLPKTLTARKQTESDSSTSSTDTLSEDDLSSSGSDSFSLGSDCDDCSESGDGLFSQSEIKKEEFLVVVLLFSPLFESGGSSDVGIHARVLKLIEDACSSFRGNLVECDQRKFVVLFAKDGCSNVQALNFAQSVKEGVTKMNMEVLSDSLKFIKVGIGMTFGDVSHGILGHRFRRFGVLFGKAKDVALGLCKYALSMYEKSQILVSDRVKLTGSGAQVVKAVEPVEILLFPLGSTCEKTLFIVNVYKLSVIMENSNQEHAWMVTRNSLEGVGKLKKVFSSLKEGNNSEALRLSKDISNSTSKVDNLVKFVEKMEKQDIDFSKWVEDKKETLSFPLPMYIPMMKSIMQI